MATSSLLVRTTATLALSALAIVGTATFALNRFVIEPITERAADDEAALLVLSAQTWVELPPQARPLFELELAESHDLIISEQTRELPPATTDAPYLELVGSQLAKRLGQPVLLMESDDLVWANVPMGGYLMQIGFSPSRQSIQPLYGGIFISALGAAIVFLTSLFIVRRIARPLSAAAERAGSFRGSEHFQPLPEEGPEELVSLARSFNTMAREVSALLANRTTLLAGISHDLRTPLARMRIALELLPENVEPDLFQRFERNLEAMDELIGDTLRFARGASESPLKVVLKPYLDDVVASFDEAVEVSWQGPEDASVELAAGSFKRVIHNLLSNAQRYGRDVRVAARVKPDAAIISVLDRGPGIEPEYRQKVFEPFFRLDASRSVTTGGSGLGLAIVAQLCNAHGWRISVRDATTGENELRLLIPIHRFSE